MQPLFIEADKIINGERQDQYGNPEDSFGRIAAYWAVYLRDINPEELDALDVAHMMMLFKIARMQGQTPCRDNYTDTAGYTAIAADRILSKMGYMTINGELEPILQRPEETR